MHTLHLISHTHWDREWYQTFQQFRLRLVHLVDGLLDILDTDSRYLHFMLDGQTIVLEDYLQIRPEREADLRRYVQNGRVLIGPWYILPDEFLVSSEATVRNLLEGDRIARQFGPKMAVGYIPDPFGHIGQMPQILQGFGIQNASLWRGVEGQQPNEFWWQSPNGSRVLMGYLRDGYGNAAGILGSNLDGFVAEVGSLRDGLAANTAGEHLLLMHGTDHQEANPVTADALAYAAERLTGDRLVHSTLPAYFDCVRSTLDLDRLPVVTGELRDAKAAPMLPGVLSARMWIKQRNRACETLLEKWAEPFSAWAQAAAAPGSHPVSGLRHPEAVLRQAWRLLMQCHPHDSICGCSIDQVHDEMRPRFDQVEQMGEEVTRQSLETLSSLVTTRPDWAEGAGDVSAAVVVFNPTAGPRTDRVSVVIEALSESGEFDLLDESGAAVPFQSVGMGNGELFNMKMDRKAFIGGINMVADGTVMDMKIQNTRIQRRGSEVTVELRVSHTGAPDRAWVQSREEIETLTKDESITEYQVLIRAVSSSQVMFTARDIPGFGYRTYWVRSKISTAAEPAQLSPAARALMPVAAKLAANPAAQKLMTRVMPDPSGKPPYRIENEFFVVEAQADGLLDIHDKRTGTLYRGQNRFVDGGDRGDEYNFSPPAEDRVVQARFKSARVERGAVQQTITLELVLDAPECLSADRKSRAPKTVALPVTSRVTLTTGVARVDIHTEVNNLAQDHRLRVHFTAPFAVSEAEQDGHFEIARRPTALPAFDQSWVEQPRPEVPQRAFTAVSNGYINLMVANRGLPEVEVRAVNGGTDIAVTLLRCVGWLSRDDFPERQGHAGPAMATPGAQMPGSWAFDYAVIPHPAQNRLAAIQQAYAFEAPLRAVTTSVHEGSLPERGAFIQVEPPEFAISAVKTAEDGRGWLVRGYNLSAQPITAQVQPGLPYQAAERVNLAEDSLASLPAETGQPVSLEVQGYQIATIRFW